MTDAAFVQGLTLMVRAGLPGWPEDREIAAERSRALRELLDDITDAAWLHACTEVAKHERWFPVPGVLREYAGTYQPPYPLLPPARTEEEREADREAARKGLELIKAAFDARQAREEQA